MNRKAAYRGMVMGMAVAVCLAAGPAPAASPLESLGKAAASAARRGGIKAPGRSLRGINPSRGLSSLGGRSLRGITSPRSRDPFSGSTAGRALRDGLSSGRNGLRAPGTLSGRGSSGRDLGKGLNRDGIMDALGGLMNRGGYGDYGGYGGFGGWNDYENEMADAYRDVGIANAVVGLVGIAAQFAQARQYAAPAQQYRTERVLVAPARYETTQVWIPESYDPRTGVKLGGGFYETRTQYVPEVYEDHLVPVASAAPVYAPAPVAVSAPAPAAIPYAAHSAGALLPPPPPPSRAQLAGAWVNPAYR